MRKADIKDFEGKTVKSVDLHCSNMWTFHFTDGSEIDIWSETDGPYAIPCLFVEEPVKIEEEK